MYNPKISIIVPIEPDKSPRKFLESLEKVNYPKDKLEILIIRGKNPPAQRNEGIKKAKGKIIFFFDSDVILTPSVIMRNLKFFKDKKVAAVGGPNLTPKTDSFMQKAFGCVMGSLFGAANMIYRSKPIGNAREAKESDLILCNLSIRSGIAKQNLFNEKLYPNEENELINRVKSLNYKLIYDPEAYVYHSRKKTIQDFVKRVFSSGKGRATQIFIQKSPANIIHFIPSIFIIYLISLIFLQNLFFLIPLLLYISSDVFYSSFITINEKDIKLFAVLPFLFPLVHFSYGMGFIWGIVKRVL